MDSAFYREEAKRLRALARNAGARHELLRIAKDLEERAVAFDIEMVFAGSKPAKTRNKAK